jgi:hypothetical protein
MSNKAARRRRRQQQRLRELEDVPPELDHVACADADLASIDGLLDDAHDVLHELAGAAASARQSWPPEAETDELRALLEAVHHAATESRNKLAAARERAARYRDAEHHLHVLGGRVVRMVPVVEDEACDATDDIPF